jgi:hypothetical protein
LARLLEPYALIWILRCVAASVPTSPSAYCAARVDPDRVTAPAVTIVRAPVVKLVFCPRIVVRGRDIARIPLYVWYASAWPSRLTEVTSSSEKYDHCRYLDNV